MAEDSRRVTAQLDHPLNDKDQEVISFIKNKFSDYKKVESYQSEKVVTRNDTKYVLVQEDQAKKTFERRQQLLHQGFFTPANRPYKTVGMLCYDNIDLCSSWLSLQDQELLKTHWEKKFGKKSGVGVNSCKFTQEKAKKDEHVKFPVLADNPFAFDGFTQLKLHLKEMVELRHGVRSGRPLVFCLREQDRKSASAKIVALPKHQCQTTSHDRSMPLEKEARTAPSMAINEQVLHPAEDENLQRILYRKQELLAEKLEWIYAMLCGITHMRNRDIKTLVPLNSSYINIIMKDTEKTNILLKQSHSYYNPPVNATRRLVSLAHEDCHLTPEVWENFISYHDNNTEPKTSSARPTGHKPVLPGARRKVGPREQVTQEDTGDMPPWLALLLDENSNLEKKPQSPSTRGTSKLGAGLTDMLERAKADSLSMRRATNDQIEFGLVEKKKNRDERMRTLVNALVASKTNRSLSSLLCSIRSELKEPKSNVGLWFVTLQNEAIELAGDPDKYNSILQKIAQFQSFSNKKVLHSKEKFCLLVHSLPANQLLRPGMQEALLFLTGNVLQLLPRILKQWYQNMRLPFTVAINS